MNTKRILLVTAVLCIAALAAIGTKGQDSHTTLALPLERSANPVPQFDVPPKETHMYAWDGSEQGTTIRRYCADKSRFLLMSQDGAWHCLALSFLVQQTRTTSPTPPKAGTPVEIPKSVWDSTTFRYMLDADVPYLTIDNYGTIVIKNCTVDWAVLGESLAISCTPGGNKVEGTLYLKPSEPKP